MPETTPALPSPRLHPNLSRIPRVPKLPLKRDEERGRERERKEKQKKEKAEKEQAKEKSRKGNNDEKVTTYINDKRLFVYRHGVTSDC